MNSILSADMYPVIASRDPNERLNLFLKTGGSAFQNLIDSLIIHDEVVIPTQDFLVVNVLVGIIGEANLRRCLESGILRFVRIRGVLAYAGSGGHVHGLCSLTTKACTEEDPKSASTEEVLHWAFSGLTESNETPFLRTEIMESITEIEISTLLQNTVNDTKLDLSQSVLYEKFESEEIAKGVLPGLAPADVRIYESPHIKGQCDDVDLVLHTANVNIEIALSETQKCTSCSTSSPILSVLQAKDAEIRGREEHKRFFELRKAASIPDLGRGVVEKNIDFQKILKIRLGRNAEEFRAWFHSVENDANIGKEYIDVLRQESVVDSLPIRAIRLIATSVVGALEPFSGLAAAAADSFLVTEVFGKHKTKYFVEKLYELGDYKK